MELIEGSDTSAISIVTPGNYPKENIILHVILYLVPRTHSSYNL